MPGGARRHAGRGRRLRRLPLLRRGLLRQRRHARRRRRHGRVTDFPTRHERTDHMDEHQVLERSGRSSRRSRFRVPAEAGMETTWEQLDVDSLDLVELVRALEDEYGIEIDDEKLKPIASVGDAVRLVIELGGTGVLTVDVVVTGRGVVSSIGEGADAFLDALVARRSGVVDGIGPLLGLRSGAVHDREGGPPVRSLHPLRRRRRRAGGRGGRPAGRASIPADRRGHRNRRRRARDAAGPGASRGRTAGIGPCRRTSSP